MPGSDELHVHRSGGGIPTPVVLSRSEHCISRKNIDPDALKVMVRLHRHGFKACLVGGSVRDLLLGREPKDFDVGTDAHPGQIKKLFHNSRIIGRRFRLVHVFFRNNKIIEVSTFRRAPEVSEVQLPDGEQDKKGDNTFGEPHEDARRRDLTINGLFYDISDFSVVDYVGGFADLRAGIVRIIGSPDDRIHEDPLRMMRAVRHTVRTGFQMEPHTHAAIVRQASLLRESNPSRLQDEFQKDFDSGLFAPILRLQLETGLLGAYFPELRDYLTQTLSPGQEALFDPSWVWRALDRVEAEGEAVPTRKFRLAAIFYPLLAKRLAAVQGSPSALPSRQADVHQFLVDCAMPIGVARKEREPLEALWRGWQRFMEHLASGRIPMRFQNKPYFTEVLLWDRFFRLVAGVPEQRFEEGRLHSMQAGPLGRGRTRRKRRKNKRLKSATENST